MKQPWHTRGYLKLSHALLYVGMQLNAGNLSPVDAEAAIDVLVKAGREVRRQAEEKIRLAK